MSIDIYPKGPSHKKAEFYLAKARELRAEVFRDAARHIAEDIRGLWLAVTGHRHA